MGDPGTAVTRSIARLDIATNGRDVYRHGRGVECKYCPASLGPIAPNDAVLDARISSTVMQYARGVGAAMRCVILDDAMTDRRVPVVNRDTAGEVTQISFNAAAHDSWTAIDQPNATTRFR